MERKGRIVVLALVLVLGAVVPAGAATEDLDFVRKETQRRGPLDRFMWGALATDRAELRELWDKYQQRGPLPTIHFERNVAVVAGTGGSSSCPTHLHDLRLNRERKRIIARMYQMDPGGDGACTDDWIPTTFTVVVKRSDLKPLDIGELSVRSRRIDDPDA